MRAGVRLIVAGLFALTGCLYDSEDRCDDNQRYDEDRKVCVCVDGAIALPFGCLTCPEGATVVNNECVAP